MRIALCLEYPIDQLGGVEVLVTELIQGLAPRHQIILVSADDSASLARSKIAPLVTEHVAFSPAAYSMAGARALADKIGRTRPDVAHFHFGLYAFGNRFPFHCPIPHLDWQGIPCVTTAHMVDGLFDGYCGPQKPSWFKGLMFPLVWCGKMQQLRHVRHEIAVSRHNLRKLQARYFPLRRRFSQIYHSRLRETAEIKKEPRLPVILNVGHVARRKGQMVLAQAFARIAIRFPEWSLQLAGPDVDGETAEAIRNLARKQQLEGRLQLLGKRNDAPELMRRAGIYVQPSFVEGLPLALQEAMFHGCASIASRIPPHQELIQENQSGLLFEPGNSDQLAGALEKLIQNSPQRETFGQAAAASIRERKMTSPGMIQRHLELYHAVTGKN